MEKFDGISIILMETWFVPDLIFSTDACLETIGGWAQGEYFTQDIPEFIKNNQQIHINELEMLAVIIGLKVWANRYRNCNFLIYCNYHVTVDVINSGKAKNRFL